MFFLLVLIIIALVTILFGGKFQNLYNIKFKYEWLALTAVIVKIISIAGFLDNYGLSPIIPLLRAISMLLILLFLVLNIKLKGMPLVFIGLLANSIVIWINGGRMPVSDTFAHMAFSAQEIFELRAGNQVDSFVLASTSTKLNFLGDIIPMPEWIPLTKLFSFGDIIITIGAAIFIVYYLRFYNKGFAQIEKGGR